MRAIGLPRVTEVPFQGFPLKSPVAKAVMTLLLACLCIFSQQTHGANWSKVKTLQYSASAYTQYGQFGAPVEISKDSCSVSYACAGCDQYKGNSTTSPLYQGRILVDRLSSCGLRARYWIGAEPEDRQVISAMSQSGHIFAYGAYRSNAGGATNGGQVRVVQFIGDNYVQKGQYLYGESGGEEFGRDIALSSDGSRLAVASKKGVSVYRYTEQQEWRRLGERILPEGSFDPGSGAAVIALSGDGYLITIKANSGLTLEQYAWDEGLWEWRKQLPHLTLPAGARDFDVSENGEEIIAGIPDGSGYALIYRRNGSGSSWVAMGDSSDIKGLSRAEILQLNSGFTDGYNENHFTDEGLGHAVAISSDGSRLAVSSRQYREPIKRQSDAEKFDPINYCKGRTLVFEWNPVQASWQQLGQQIQNCRNYKDVVDNIFGVDKYLYTYVGEDGADIDLSGDGTHLIIGNTERWNKQRNVPAGWATVYELKNYTPPPDVVTVTPISSANGSINPSSAVTLYQGGFADFEIVPSEGYVVTLPVGGTCPGSFSGTIYTVGPIDEPCTVAPTFELKLYQVEPRALGGGSISPDDSQVVAPGDSITFTAIPDDGYTTAGFASSCPGDEIETLSGAIFKAGPIVSDCEVEAVFGRTHIVTPSATVGGKTSPDTPVAVAAGGFYTFELEADDGYRLAFVGGTCIGSLSGSSYKAGPFSGDCTVEASFVASYVGLPFKITTAATEGGVITPDSPTVFGGDTQGFKLLADDGYFMAGVETSCPGYVEDNNRWFRTYEIVADCYINVTFRKLKVTVAASVTGEGSVTPALQEIEGGSTALFAIAPAPSYSVASVEGSCPVGEFDGDRKNYRVEAVPNDCDVVFNLTKGGSATITATAGAGGGVVPASQTVAEPPADVYLTVTPEAGNQIARVGGSCPRGDFVTDSRGNYLIREAYIDCTVSFEFSQDELTVTPQASSGGAISPDSDVVLRPGEFTDFNVIPDSGWELASVGGTCPGELLGDIFRVGPVIDDCSVIVSFRAAGFEPEWARVGARVVGDPNSQFGRKVAISADGGWFAAKGYRTGTKVYRYDAGSATWVQAGGVIFNNTTDYDIDLSIAAGDQAYPKLAAGSNVLIFDGNNWEVSGQGGVPLDTNVAVLSLDGETLLRGATGSVYLSTWSDSAQVWTEQARLYGNNAGDGFGFSADLSFDKNIVVVGAPFKGADGQEGEGYAKVFRREGEGSEWRQMGSDIGGGYYFGQYVSISALGNRIAVGSEQTNNLAGSVQVYEWDSATLNWSPLGAPINGESAEQLRSPTLTGDGRRLAIAGVSYQSKKGRLRVFDLSPDRQRWEPVGAAIVGGRRDTFFGYDAEITPDGTRFIAGATEQKSTKQGYAEVYGLGGVSTEFQVTSNSNVGGAIFPSGSRSVRAGGVVSYLLNASEGSSLAGVEGSCTYAVSGEAITIGPVYEDCSFSVDFELAVVPVTAESSSGGSISPEGEVEVPAGERAEFSVSAAPNYQLAAMGGTCSGDLVGASYITAPIYSSCSVFASYRKWMPPPAPAIGSYEFSEGVLAVNFKPAPSDLEPPVYEYTAVCVASDGQSYRGVSSKSPVLVSGLKEGDKYSCQIYWDNGVSKLGSSEFEVLAEEDIPSGLPIWLLYQATQKPEDARP